MKAINSDESYFPNFEHGMQEILSWRNRYSKTEYPEKVMINTFYRQYSVNFIWENLHSAFKRNIFGKSKQSFNDFTSAREYISQIYRQAQLQKVQPVLMELIGKRKDVGGLVFQNIFNLVNSARSNNNKAIEELEYSYIYYALANEYLFRWSACGMIGQNKQEAFIAVTGIGVNVDSMTTYENSLNLIGQLGAGRFLQNNYKAYPNYF
jgi:hypothetical protein